MQGLQSTPSLTLTSETRAKFDRALPLVEAYADNGLDPTSAVVKAASECGLSPGHARSLARFYNTGQSALQLRDSETEKRASGFALADGDEAASRLGEELRKTAYAQMQSSEHYAEPPRPRARPFAKVAAFADPPEPVAYPVNRDRDAIREVSRIRSIQKQAQQRESQIDKAVRTLDGQLDSVAAYLWKQASPSLGTVQAFIEQSGQSDLLPICNEIRARAPYLEKRAADKLPRRTPEIAQAVAMVRECADKTAALLQQIDDHLVEDAATGKQAQEILADIPMADKPFDLMACFDRTPEVRKVAAGGQTLVNMLTGAVSGRAAASKPGPDASAVKSYLHELDDPPHANAMQAIRTRSNVEQLMASDPALRDYHPDEVLSAFNEISRTAPQLQSNGMQMASMVRRYLSQGNALAPDDIVSNLITPAQKATEQVMRPVPARPEYPGPVPRNTPLKAFKETAGAAGTFAAQSVQSPDRPEAPDAPTKPPADPTAPKPGWMPGSPPTDLQPTDFDNSAGASDGSDLQPGGDDAISNWLRSGGDEDAIAGRLQSNPGQSTLNIL